MCRWRLYVTRVDGAEALLAAGDGVSPPTTIFAHTNGRPTRVEVADTADRQWGPGTAIQVVDLDDAMRLRQDDDPLAW